MFSSVVGDIYELFIRGKVIIGGGNYCNMIHYKSVIKIRFINDLIIQQYKNRPSN